MMFKALENIQDPAMRCEILSAVTHLTTTPYSETALKEYLDTFEINYGLRERLALEACFEEYVLGCIPLNKRFNRLPTRSTSKSRIIKRSLANQQTDKGDKMIIVTADVIIPVEEIKYIYKEGTYKKGDCDYVLITKTGGEVYLSKESYAQIALTLRESGFTEKLQKHE